MTQDKTAIKFAILVSLIMAAIVLVVTIMVIGSQMAGFNTVDVNSIIGAPIEMMP